MKTTLDCIPCFIRQALEAARFVTHDTTIHEQALRDVLRVAAEMNFAQTPPVVAQQIHRHLRGLTGVDDPYLAAKQTFNRMAMEMLPELAEKVRCSPQPLITALRLAIAGNVIDLGVPGELTEEKARQAIENTLHEPFHGDTDAFARDIQQAERILYLADNAGEIVFDRLLIEQLPLGRVTVAVRGRAILNDATLQDAHVAGLPELVPVIDNGSDAPGTVLDDCSDAFCREFQQADLILAKGQGNFETLSDCDANIIFLFKAKCPVIADHVNLPLGTHIAMRT